MDERAIDLKALVGGRAELFELELVKAVYYPPVWQGRVIINVACYLGRTGRRQPSN